jgi:hypothetical protein
MKYQISLLIIFVLVVSSFSFYDAFASGPLSFDRTSIILDHSGVISCIGCTDVDPSITVTLNGGTGAAPPNTKTITLYKVIDSSPLTYQSVFIKFYNCPTTCGTYEYDVNANDVITATASGYTATPAATIFTTDASLDNNTSKYGKPFKPIKPWSYAVCNNYHGDSDGDYICNDWEDSSVVPFPSACTTPPSNPVGKGLCIRTIDSTSKVYYLNCDNNDPTKLCPSKDKADLYIEIDWMRGHKPTADVISAVSTAFASSNYNSTNNVMGINFHAQLDEEFLVHVDSIPSIGSTGTPGFDQLKYWWFGTAAERTYSAFSENLASDWINNNNIANKRSLKGQVFHYAIFGHSYSEDTTSSGVSEQLGNDVFVTLGAFDGKVGSKDMQKGTLLHELGHNFSLDHGGSTAMGCKPNYLSVMSYTRQSTDFVSDRPLDYSRSKLPTLSENSLNETRGVGQSLPPGLKTAYGPFTSIVNNTGIPIDWNRDGDFVDTGVSADINYFNGISKCGSSSGQTLAGFLDWDRTKMRLAPLGNLGGGEGDAAFPPGHPEYQDYDRLSSNDDGISATLVTSNELSSEDIVNLRVAKIDSLIIALDKTPDSDLAWNPSDVRELYHDELNKVRIDIMKTNRGDNAMVDAYSKMLAFQSRLDGEGTNEIISNDKIRQSILNQTNDIILSQSKAIPEFSTFSILVLVIVFATIVFFSKNQSMFGIKLGYSNI